MLPCQEQMPSSGHSGTDPVATPCSEVSAFTIRQNIGVGVASTFAYAKAPSLSWEGEACFSAVSSRHVPSTDPPTSWVNCGHVCVLTRPRSGLTSQCSPGSYKPAPESPVLRKRGALHVNLHPGGPWAHGVAASIRRGPRFWTEPVAPATM